MITFRGLQSIALGISFAAAAGQLAAAAVHEAVVVDPNNATVYLTRPTAKLASVRISDGGVNWESSAPLRPLQLMPSGLLVLSEPPAGGELSLALVDVNSGTSESRFAVRTDATVVASIRDSLNRAFRARTLSDGRIAWSYMERAAGGARLDDSGEPARQFSGVIQVNQDGASAQSTGESAPVNRANRLATSSAIAGVPGRHFVSEDGMHLLASVRRRGPDGQRFRWSVYTSEGEPLGSFGATVSYAPFVVSAGRVLFVTPKRVDMRGSQASASPLSLTAMDLANGELAWMQEIADLRYAGPYPP